MTESVAAPADVLAFWFDAPPLARRKAWFQKSDAFDALVRDRYGATVDTALRGRLGPEWTLVPLAEILLLDQFTRNIHRGTALAFAGDARALALARDVVSIGADRALHPIERGFAYLPFEHAEDIAAQDESMRLFTALAADDPQQAELLDYARRHRDIVLRFGRFPHRNAALGRASSADELVFLQQPGSGF